MTAVKTFLREQVIFLVVAFVSFSTGPAIVTAQEYNPVPFVEPLSVSRGSFIPNGLDAVVYSEEDMCRLSREYWGWDSCTHVDAYVEYGAGDLDSALIEKPDSSGYVQYDDWNTDERETVIAEIERTTRQSLIAQSAQLGIPISFVGWSVYPTLDQERNIMYYAFEMNWEGERVINIEASVFDRRGYVTFSLVPYTQDITEASVRRMIVDVLDQYQPNEGQSYASFVSGDRVAAVGAVGVLAALAGIQYSKGASGGILAVLLLFLKKAWFVLLIPFFWLKNLFRRKDGE